MAVWNCKELMKHAGHDIVLSPYAGEPCLECETCGEVLLEFHDEAKYDGGDYMGDYIEIGPEPECE